MKLLPENCVCCEKELGAKNLATFDCCSRPQAAMVAHQDCLFNALQPKKIMVKDKEILEPATCPCCARKPQYAALTAEQITFIESIDPALASELHEQLPLHEIVQYYNSGWSAVNFLARYGSRLAVDEVTRLLGGLSYHGAVLQDLAQYHQPEIFQAMLAKCAAGESVHFITRENVLPLIRKNPHCAKIMEILVARLLEDKLCFDPKSDVGKEIWNAFTKETVQKQILISALAKSQLIEHMFYLARIYRYGIGQSSIDRDNQVAFDCYWKVINAIVNHLPFDEKNCLMLDESCQFVVENLKNNRSVEAQKLILAVHLLVLSEDRSNTLLGFIYNDFLSLGAVVNDFLNVYKLLNAEHIKKSCNTNGWTPLHYILRYWPEREVGYSQLVAVIKALVELGADINAVDTEGNRPIHYFCRYSSESTVLTSKEKVQIVLWLVDDLSALVNVTNSEEKTPLHYVCEKWLQANREPQCVVDAMKCLAKKTDLKQHADILRILIERWTGRGIKDELLAEAVCFLLKNGADPNQGKASEPSLLHLVALSWLSNKVDVKQIFVVMRLLVESGVNANALGNFNQNSLTCICEEWVRQKISMSDVNEAVKLLSPKMNREALAQTLEMLLTTWPACAVNSENINSNLQYIVQFNIDAEHRNHENDSLLHLIGKYWSQHNIDVLETRFAITLLVKAGVDINALNNDRDTLLNIICTTWSGRRECVLESIDYVLKLGAKADIANSQGNLPIHSVFLGWAKWVDLTQITAALNSLMPQSIDAANGMGKTLLHIVCDDWNKQREVDFALVEATVALLMERGAQVNVVTVEGFTPLHSVCVLGERSNSQAIQLSEKLLSQVTAMINAKTNQNVTALQLFARNFMGNANKDLNGAEQILDHLGFFLQAGAEVNAADSALSTPVHLLAHFWIQQGARPDKIMAAIKLLVDKGADLNAVSTVYSCLAMIIGCDWIGRASPAEVLDALRTSHELGANLCVEESDGANLLHHVVSWAEHDVSILVIQEALQFLLSLNVNPNKQNAHQQTPLHILCRNGLLWKVSVGDIQKTLELFFTKNPELELRDKDGLTPLLCVAKYWLAMGANYDDMSSTLKRLNQLGARADIQDGKGENLLFYFAQEWFKHIDNPAVVFDQIIELAPCIDVNVVSNGISVMHILCRDWLVKGVKYADMNAVICGLIGKKTSMNVKDPSGDTPILIMVKEWLCQIEFSQLLFTLELCLFNGAYVNAVDSSGKTLLHLIFEKWGRVLNALHFSQFLDVMEKYKANFNSVDQQNCSPAHYLFTHWQDIANNDYCMSMLQRFEAHGADFGVQDNNGVTVLHLAASRSSAKVFSHVLANFASSERVVQFATDAQYEHSLLGRLTGHSPEADEKCNALCSYLIRANVPLEFDMVLAQNFWRHIVRSDRVEELKQVIQRDGNDMQTASLARFYRNADKVNAKIDVEQARAIYEIAMIKIFTGKNYALTPEKLSLVDEIQTFWQEKERSGMKINRTGFITEAERTALGLFFGEEKVAANPNKAVQELESLTKKFLLREASIFACTVLARHYEQGYMLPMFDIGRAVYFYSLALDLQIPAEKLTAFLSACRDCALVSIERLSEEHEEARVSLVKHFAKRDSLDVAEKWYNSLITKTPELKALLGELCVRRGEPDRAIDQYQFIPALLKRAEATSKSAGYTDGAKDYCRIILLARDDVKIQEKAVEGLVKLAPKLIERKLCGTAIVDVMINVIGRGNYQRGNVDKVVSAFGMERLFSTNACQPQKVESGLFKKINKAIDAQKRVYTTAYAEAYLYIMSDALFDRFRESFAEGQASQAAKELIQAIERNDTPLPSYLLDDVFMGRVKQLQQLQMEQGSKQTI